MMIINNKCQHSKLFYIHGYQSSPQGNKGLLFKEKLNIEAIKYRDCEPEELNISNCLKRILDVIKNEISVVLIGSSLGGFLAASTTINHANVKKLILLNPTIIPPSAKLNNFVGVPRRILEDMKDDRLFKNKINTEIIILRSTEDELIPDSWIFKFAKVQEAMIIFLHDDHKFSRNLSKLPKILGKLLKK